MSLAVGDGVVTSDADPDGHHRLPRYLRGKRGIIEAAHGRYPIADIRAMGRTDAPSEMLYTVAFDAYDVWGQYAEENGVIHAELWESYLERT
jgi:hypothetical protein